MSRALIYLLLVASSYARGTGRPEKEEAEIEVPEIVETAGEGMSPNDRKGKCKRTFIRCRFKIKNLLRIYLVFSVFQIVKFQNGKCTTSTGDDGTCYTEAECMAAGGEPSGACASSFGVCCLCKWRKLYF